MQDNTPQLMNKVDSGYSDDTMEKIKVFARDGFSPSQIATLLELSGIDRAKMISDILNKVHPIGKLYHQHIQGYDMENKLNMMAVDGNTDAILLAIKQEDRNYISSIKRELFGL